MLSSPRFCNFAPRRNRHRRGDHRLPEGPTPGFLQISHIFHRRVVDFCRKASVDRIALLYYDRDMRWIVVSRRKEFSGSSTRGIFRKIIFFSIFFYAASAHNLERMAMSRAEGSFDGGFEAVELLIRDERERRSCETAAMDKDPILDGRHMTMFLSPKPSKEGKK